MREAAADRTTENRAARYDGPFGGGQSVEHDPAFLRPILARPDDDAPRLIYADRLDGHGHPERGEFIRVQCELAQTDSDAPGRRELERREAELLDAHGLAWAAHLGERVSEWQYERGFVERVETSLEMPPSALIELGRREPIRHWRDVGQTSDLGPLVEALACLTPMTGLEFWGLYAFNNDRVADLLTSRHLRRLRTLVLHHDRNGNMVDDAVLCRAMARPLWKNLRTLALNVDSMWRGPSNRLLRIVAESPQFRGLRRFDASNAGDAGHRPERADETVTAFAASPNFAALEELDLEWCSFTEAQWRDLLQAPWISGLRRFDLAYARIIDDQGQHVGHFTDLPDWRRRIVEIAPGVGWTREEEEGSWHWGGRPVWRGLRRDATPVSQPRAPSPGTG